MGKMVTTIKDGEVLIIDGGRVMIKPKPGKFANLVIEPSPGAQIKKIGSPNSPNAKQDRG